MSSPLCRPLTRYTPYDSVLYKCTTYEDVSYNHIHYDSVYTSTYNCSTIDNELETKELTRSQPHTKMFMSPLQPI